jgi:hypothetical protein
MFWQANFHAGSYYRKGDEHVEQVTDDGDDADNSRPTESEATATRDRSVSHVNN